MEEWLDSDFLPLCVGPSETLNEDALVQRLRFVSALLKDTHTHTIVSRRKSFQQVKAIHWVLLEGQESVSEGFKKGGTREWLKSWTRKPPWTMCTLCPVTSLHSGPFQTCSLHLRQTPLSVCCLCAHGQPPMPRWLSGPIQHCASPSSSPESLFLILGTELLVNWLGANLSTNVIFDWDKDEVSCRSAIPYLKCLDQNVFHFL